MRVLVCGGRNFEDHKLLSSVLDELHAQHVFTVVIHGAARGADRLADGWALYNKIPPYRFHALWKSKGKAAGPIRNRRMLEKGKPDLVVAFPGGAGTKDMVSAALGAGVKVLRVKPDGTVAPWVKRIDVEECL